MWSHLVDFSGCSVATGRKPVVGGRAVHSSDSSLVGYRPSRCGERTNESYRSFLYSSIHARTSARTLRARLAWLAVLRSSSIGCRLLVPRTPPFVSRDRTQVTRDCFFSGVSIVLNETRYDSRTVERLVQVFLRVSSCVRSNSHIQRMPFVYFSQGQINKR